MLSVKSKLMGSDQMCSSVEGKVGVVGGDGAGRVLGLVERRP